MPITGESFDVQAWMEKEDIRDSIKECDKLIASGIFKRENQSSPFFQPSVIYLLILLNELLQRASSLGKRVDFLEDIDQSRRSMDVTDLVNNCRNAACHIGSPLGRVDDDVFRFNVVTGAMPGAYQFRDETFGTDYADDTAIFYGYNRLYLGRHAFRALSEVRARIG